MDYVSVVLISGPAHTKVTVLISFRSRYITTAKRDWVPTGPKSSREYGGRQATRDGLRLYIPELVLSVPTRGKLPAQREEIYYAFV